VSGDDVLRLICTFWAAVALLVVTPGVAAPPDNLRLFSILEEDVSLSMDGMAPVTIKHGNIYFYHFELGDHSLVMTNASGQSVSLNVNLTEDQMATSRGRRWWCASTGIRKRDNAWMFFLDSKKLCQSVLDLAPEQDDPNDDPASK